MAAAATAQRPRTGLRPRSGPVPTEALERPVLCPSAAAVQCRPEVATSQAARARTQSHQPRQSGPAPRRRGRQRALDAGRPRGAPPGRRALPPAPSARSAPPRWSRPPGVPQRRPRPEGPRATGSRRRSRAHPRRAAPARRAAARPGPSPTASPATSRTPGAAARTRQAGEAAARPCWAAGHRRLPRNAMWAGGAASSVLAHGPAVGTPR
mmetsp:Transcript_104701/g.327690  ORF Transcript_104701/g.327690 Transcript_104701/m.327690 type:complete len:210 (-) Transcript_104701:1315-1944(-)